MYKQTKPPFEGMEAKTVKRLSDNAFIPFDPDNTDAVEFAKWLQEGNRPEPAEEDGVVTDEWVAETIAKLLP
jgi:endogenous inhibitor of DNA gyrase (YacG/DUF329 family)